MIATPVQGVAVPRSTSAADDTPQLSLVVPIYNERATLEAMVAECAEVMASLGMPWELLFVDDGSTDGSFGVIADIRARDPHIHGVRLRTNLGKSAALAVGFRAARGG